MAWGALSHRLKSAFFESSRFNHDIKALLDTLPFGVVMLDRSGGVRLFNATAERFGLTRPMGPSKNPRRRAKLGA